MKNQTVQLTFEVTPDEAEHILSAAKSRQEACVNDLEEGLYGCTLGFALSLICARYADEPSEDAPGRLSTSSTKDGACVA